MDNNTYFQLQYLKRFSDILLSSKIFFLFCAWIGAIGNAVIIFFYFFRIKERGEGYFIPFLGIVDLFGCLFVVAFYIMDNGYVFNFESITVCRIFTFLQICIPAISAHMLLVISIQRYRLVCKPLCPKLTLFWKRALFGIICLISVAYSTPVLASTDVSPREISYINITVTFKMCKFSFKRSLSLKVYFIILFLIIVTNLVITAGLYIPIIRQVKSSFLSKEVEYGKYRDRSVGPQLEIPLDTCTELSCSANERQLIYIEVKTLQTSKEQLQNVVADHCARKIGNNVVDHTFQTSKEQLRNVVADHCARKIGNNVVDHTKTSEDNKSPKMKGGSAQRRVSIMFFFLIVAYVLSYIPPIIIVILMYTSNVLKFQELNKTEMVVWKYLMPLVFLNHVVNPFIYGFFDTKLKKQLRKCCKRQKCTKE